MTSGSPLVAFVGFSANLVGRHRLLYRVGLGYYAAGIFPVGAIEVIVTPGCSRADNIDPEILRFWQITTFCLSALVTIFPMETRDLDRTIKG